MYHSLTDFVEYLTLPALHYLLLDLIYALFLWECFFCVPAVSSLYHAAESHSSSCQFAHVGGLWICIYSLNPLPLPCAVNCGTLFDFTLLRKTLISNISHNKKEVIMKRVRFNISLLFSAVIMIGAMSSCGALLVAGTAAAVSSSATQVHTTYVPTTYVPTTQVVTQVATRPVTQNVTVSAVSSDISYNLDLQAVGNIFGVSSSLEDFERRINSYDAQISNLDLNRDGYVDYLRVVEVQEGYTHLVVLQAVLATNVYQDVATIEVERYGSTNTVTIIGDPYLYGASYVLRPTYVHVPVIYNVFYGPSYRVWRSPYYWGHFPSYYRHRHCVHVNVYHQHIHVHNKNYHHSYHYIDDYRPRYEGIRNTVSRNDYAIAHPEESFSRRNSEVRNARDIQVDNTRRTAVKAADAVRKEVSSPTSSSSSRRVSSTAASKVTTTTSGSSSSRRTSTDSTPATSTTVKSEATSSSSRRTSATTGSAATTAPKVTTTTTGTSTSRRTSTSSTSAATTTSKSATSTTSSSRRTAATGTTTTSAPKVTTSSTSSSRRSSTASTPQKASSTVKASMTSGSSSVKASSSVRRSSSSSARSASTSSRSTEATTSTRSSGSRR